MYEDENIDEDISGQMSFLDHLDEFRRRLVRSIAAIFLAFIFCWIFSAPIFNFLATPVQEALTQAQRREITIKDGQTGSEKILSLSELKEGDKGKYVFDRDTNVGVAIVKAGTSVEAIVEKDKENRLGLFTDESIITSNSVISKGIRLPVDFSLKEISKNTDLERMMVTTAIEPFTLYVTVSLYAAIALSVPFLLLQIWGFISPALYRHEKKYVTPFVLLSTISFVIGAAFAYYVLFPAAVRYLIGIGSDFQIMLRATDYLDFIILIMLAMGIIFQMPAVAYVLSRIGIITAGILIRGWKIALVVILLVAAFVSPTGDVPNMMLFAAPMMVLYVVSIFVAWFFGKKRETVEE